MMSAPVDVGSLHSASSSRQPPSRPRGCHVPRSTQTCRRCWRPPPAPRRFTAVGRASPFQKAGRSGKSPVPAFAVKIIDKSPGMASHDDEQQHQQLPPPLHPSSWRLADGPSKRTKGEGGGAGKPAEFQISRTGLASSPHFFKTPPAGAAAFVVGKKGETSRRPGSCFTILVAPPVSALVSFWGVVFNFMP